MVMVVEAADPNWVDQTATSEPNGKTFYIRRIGARHGRKTADGYNAFTNVCLLRRPRRVEADRADRYGDAEVDANFRESSGFIIYTNRQ